MPIPNYWTWTRSTPQKWFSGQIVIELGWWMLELPHLRYDLINVIKFFFGVQDRNYDVINFILKLLWFQKTYSYPTLLTWSKFQPCLIKKPVKAQKKLKELEIMCPNATYIYISWYSKICWFSVKKYWCQQDSSGVSHSLWVRYNYIKYHHSRICTTYFMERDLFGPPNLWTASKKGSSSIRLKQHKAFQTTLCK